MTRFAPRLNPRTGLATAALTLVAMIVMSTQALAATSHVYNPMSLSNTTASTYTGHPVFYFSGWSSRAAYDLNSPDEYNDAPIWGWGVGWSSAQVMTGANAPVKWAVYRIIGTCTFIGYEYAMAYVLDTPSNAGHSVSHLSNYHYAAGASFAQGAQIANLSGLGDQSYYTYQDASCITLNTEGGKHIHAESAHLAPVTFSSIDPVSGPSWAPYWYYNYP